MQSLGYITAKQAAAAKATPVKVRPKAKSSLKGCANATTSIVNAGFFCDYAKLALRAAGFPQDRLETGGLRIYTTLDPQMQNSVQGVDAVRRVGQPQVASPSPTSSSRRPARCSRSASAGGTA